MLLNCDLGESYGSWTMGLDSEVMPYIDQANIACGFHAGDPLTLRNTLALAADYGVQVGAHPSYPDLVGFGRRSMALNCEEIVANLHYQIGALSGMARNTGLALAYVKPHGALYNDMMVRSEIRHAILLALASLHEPLPLMMQATSDADLHRSEAHEFGLRVQFEAFADRGYTGDGALLARSEPGAVHSREKMLAQITQLVTEGSVTTVCGQRLSLNADTVCVHGDNIEGVQAIREIRALVDGS